MKKKVWPIKLIGLIVFMVVNMNYALVYSAELMRVGGTLPAFALNAPDSSVAKAYLGLRKEKRFSLSQIEANFFVLEFFDVY